MMANALEELMKIEDDKFIKAAKEILEHVKAMAVRRRWRDGHKVMHALKRTEAWEIMSGKRMVGDWRVVCGYKRRHNSDGCPEGVVTCLQCLGDS